MPSTVARSSIPWIDPIMRPAFAISSSGQSTWTDCEVSPGDNLPAAAPSLLTPTRPGIQSKIDQLMGGMKRPDSLPGRTCPDELDTPPH
jgi:hypothetical protein